MTKKDKQELDLKDDLSLIYELVFSHVEDGVFVVDGHDRLLAVNKALAKIIGSKSEKMIGCKSAEILRFVNRHGQAVNESNHPVAKAFAKQTHTRRQNIFILDAEEQKTAVHLVVSPIFNQEKIRGVVGVIRNMSSEYEAELAKTDFVSTASHEMRTPLASLEGYLSLLLEQDLRPKTQAYAQKAHENVLRLGELFKNLLEASEGEDRQLTHDPLPCNLIRLLEEIVAEKQAQAEKQKINLRLIVPSEKKMEINADPNRLSELFNNLLDNALKYSQKRGAITVEIKEIPDFYQISVQDNGLGISKKDQPHVFQKFYRVDSSREGIGLGLFICKKIVELYKGDIWLTSELNCGTTFYVNLKKE